MPVKLRLMRMGKTKQPTYRLVASDSRSPRNGRFIELLGTYEPRQDPSRINLKAEKILHWISQGAQPTERVQKLLEIEGILTGEAAAKTDAAKKAARRPGKPSKPVSEAPADSSAADAAAATEASAKGETPEGTPEAGEVAAADSDAATDAKEATEAAAEDKA